MPCVDVRHLSLVFLGDVVMETNLSWKSVEILHQGQRLCGRDVNSFADLPPPTDCDPTSVSGLESTNKTTDGHVDHFSARLSFTGFKLKVTLT